MAESGFWASLKRFFGGGAAKQAEHERFCLSCQKVTGGSIAPKEVSPGGQAAKNFTCADCGSNTQVLQ